MSLNFADSSVPSVFCAAVSTTERTSRIALIIFFLDNIDHSISIDVTDIMYH